MPNRRTLVVMSMLELQRSAAAPPVSGEQPGADVDCARGNPSRMREALFSGGSGEGQDGRSLWNWAEPQPRMNANERESNQSRGEMFGRRGRVVKVSWPMVPAEEPARPSGRYSGESWQSTVEREGEYEWRRFERTAEGRAKNRIERTMVHRFLQRLPPGSRVLDVPAGLGRFTDLILQTGHHPISIDLNFGRIAEARRRQPGSLSSIQADVTRLPLGDQSVNAALCFRLLHHLTPEMIRQVLMELRRVAPRAFVTFYSSHTLKYYKKRLRGKPLSGRHYPPGQLIDWCRTAGWGSCRHETPFVFWRSLHGLELGT